MTVEEQDVIDFVGTDSLGNAVLTISDHLSWDEASEHLYLLQEKLNAYLRFIESGEIYQKFPTMRERPIVIDIVLRFPVPQSAEGFFTRASEAIGDAGFKLSVRQISD